MSRSGTGEAGTCPPGRPPSILRSQVLTPEERVHEIPEHGQGDDQPEDVRRRHQTFPSTQSTAKQTAKQATVIASAARSYISGPEGSCHNARSAPVNGASRAA